MFPRREAKKRAILRLIDRISLRPKRALEKMASEQLCPPRPPAPELPKKLL